MTGNVGRVSLCQKGDFLLNQRVGLLVSQIQEKEFLYQVLSSKNFEESMIACSQGAAQMNICKNDIDNYEIPFSHNHSILNQVARLLKNYDCIIELSNKLSVCYILQKQYLLSRMFI